MSLNFTQGDTAPAVTTRLHEEGDETAYIDVSPTFVDAIRFQMRKADDHRYTVNAAAEVIDGPNGQVSYSWSANDLANWGTYLFQWEITFVGGRIQTSYPPETLVVQRQ